MSPAKKFRTLEQAEFDRLLNWLDPSPELAGQRYEKIRRRLIAILASRGCHVPEELADETIDRVARRVIDIRDNYVGDPAIYFLGVMNKVHHEYLKRPARPFMLESNDDHDAKERVHSCLDQCLERMTPHARQIIEHYYREEKRAKINLRKRLAREMGVTSSNLRLRALRIRAKLQVCIDSCLEA